MAYYLRLIADHVTPEVWRIDDNEAMRLGYGDPRTYPGSFHQRGEHPSIWHAIEAGATGWLSRPWPFRRLDLDAQHYYPRIARPLPGGSLCSPSAWIEPDVLAMGVGQAKALMRRLEAICQTVHPSAATFAAYGHEIRNILILAATEVETHCRGVLVANGFTHSNPSTSEYVRLLEPMRLDEYAVAFPSFPWLDPIAPFRDWDPERATKSLAWYDAYNGVKHNRELEFPRANLGHAFEAVSACIVLLAAQFTPSAGLGGQSDLAAFFQFVEMPSWAYADSYAREQAIWPPGGPEPTWFAVAHSELSAPVRPRRSKPRQA